MLKISYQFFLSNTFNYYICYVINRTNMKRNLAIGIAGHKGAGKDTATSMISYIIRNGNHAKFNEWLVKCDNVNKETIGRIAFGDALKEFLANSLNIDIRAFYSQRYKDELWYDFEDEKFITDKEINSHKLSENNFYVPITPESLNMSGLNMIDYNSPREHHIIKLRTLLQWFGTDFIRHKFYGNAWVNITCNKAKEILDKNHFVIFSDVRFRNEAVAIAERFDAKIIKIDRNDEIEDKHESEVIDFYTDYFIYNNNSKMALFYKLVNLIKEL